MKPLFADLLWLGVTAPFAYDDTADWQAVSLATCGSMRSRTSQPVWSLSDTEPAADPSTGTLFFYDLRPFSPRLGPSAGGAFPFDSLLDRTLFRRARMDGAAQSQNEANAAIYDQYVLTRSTDATPGVAASRATKLSMRDMATR